jgi:glyoxylase-like metal-dependent hydrolase (beta-lactamase superfamily II)
MYRTIGGVFVLLGLWSVSAAAQINIAGEWVGRYHEDQIDRVPGDVNGDYTGIPVNDAARRYAEIWDVSRIGVLEHQCQPYNSVHIWRGPHQFRIWETKNPDTQEVIAYEMFYGHFMQRRTIWMDGRAHPPAYAPHTFVGFSTGKWNGDILTVTTTHIKKEYLRRSGIPSSDQTTMMEYFTRHGNLLSHVTIATDPVYLTEPYITSEEFVYMDRGNQNWIYNCEYTNETGSEKYKVPHWLPGKNEFVDDWADKFGIPLAAAWGGAESLYPEYMPKLEAAMANKTPLTVRSDSQPADVPADKQIPQGEIKTVHVKGNVYMLVGAGANIAVNVGEQGIIVVDTGSAEMGDKVLAAIRQLSTKPIRWVINTHMHPDHTGANEQISLSGQSVNGNPAPIIAYETTLAQMTEAGRPINSRPINTFFDEQRDFPFNGEAVFLRHVPRGHSDGDVFVYFRASDVLVAGDLFLTTTYPVIDSKLGGGVQGFIDGLAAIMDLTVPEHHQDGGTYVIPGHGRISDEADVVEYRDMIVKVRDRIQDAISRGLTLAQVRAEKPTLDFDRRYGSDTGAWTTDMFIEAVYNDLRQLNQRSN